MGVDFMLDQIFGFIGLPYVKNMFVKKITFVAAFFILTLSSAFAQPSKTNLNIVFIGNSITYGAGLNDPAREAPPVLASQYLRKQSNIGSVAFLNQGYSGYTTVDFLPATHGAFTKVETAAKAFTNKTALLIFSIKLGTNDSAIQGPNGSPVSAENYKKNLTVIIDSLLKEFPTCIVIIQHPLWYSPNTYNGAKYLQEGLTRLISYNKQIVNLISDYKMQQHGRVFNGDTKAFNFFKAHYLTDLQPEQGHQGMFYLHPNEKGAITLGTYWGEAINKVIKQVAK